MEHQQHQLLLQEGKRLGMWKHWLSLVKFAPVRPAPLHHQPSHPVLRDDACDVYDALCGDFGGRALRLMMFLRKERKAMLRQESVCAYSALII